MHLGERGATEDGRKFNIRGQNCTVVTSVPSSPTSSLGARHVELCRST